MELLHYARAPVTEIVTVKQLDHPHFKPQGLWLSVGDAWKEWCEAEDFGTDSLRCIHEVRLAPGAKILRIKTAGALDAFTERYTSGRSRPMSYYTIDWAAVARSCQGIIIAPYIWERRLHGGCDWYYCWDCASGCIWDADAIASVTLKQPERTHGMEGPPESHR